MPPTTAADALDILDTLTSIGADPIVAGGRGIDALIGEQGRDHADIDIAIDAGSEASALDALTDAGYRTSTDWRPIRISLTHPLGPAVDLHPVTIGGDGTRIQQGCDGATFEYPASDITIGTIGGREVACISARLQMRFHEGYEPQEKDIDDCRRLAAATGAHLPVWIGPTT
ncbi:amino acid transporter [bacterium]|nr:amino acid transporter [bacterium]